ncbi:MAG: restriction endonuclease subunit S [Chitinophagaceae bacterium]|nr:MAG: restriction endonuclease subunit S [Chitinophagaceae bacterium]
MSNWKEYKFSDFVKINPSIKLRKGQVYSFVEMKDLNDGNKFCEPHAERALSGGARFQEGDTLFARITPCLENGKICQVRNLKDQVGFGSTEFHVFRGREGISDNDFVYYLSRWEEVRAFAEMNFDGTSGRQRVPKEAFDNLFLKLPDLPEQVQIAKSLSALDNKIDLLQKSNGTLQSLADSIFQQWFIRNEEDWELGAIEDEFQFTMGQSPPGSSFNDIGKGLPFFQGNADFGFRFPLKRIYTTSPKKHAKKFDTLITVRAPIGDMNIALEDCCIGRGVAAFRYKQNNNFHSYTYYKMQSLLAPIKEYEDNGTVFGAIGKEDFKKIKNPLPDKDLIEKFEETVSPLDKKIYENTVQIKNLEKLRNTLLPKLMTGEATIKQ